MLAVMKEFHGRGRLSKGLGATFIALIPKRTQGLILIEILDPLVLLAVCTRYCQKC